jgi:hypothetical protein
MTQSFRHFLTITRALFRHLFSSTCTRSLSLISTPRVLGTNLLATSPSFAPLSKIRFLEMLRPVCCRFMQFTTRSQRYGRLNPSANSHVLGIPCLELTVGRKVRIIVFTALSSHRCASRVECHAALHRIMVHPFPLHKGMPVCGHARFMSTSHMR